MTKEGKRIHIEAILLFQEMTVTSDVTQAVNASCHLPIKSTRLKVPSLAGTHGSTHSTSLGHFFQRRHFFDSKIQNKTSVFFSWVCSPRALYSRLHLIHLMDTSQ